MTNVGDHVRCPRCGRKARVVWVSQDKKTAAIRCMGYHSHDEMRARKTSSYYKTKPKPKKKAMVFLVEATKNE